MTTISQPYDSYHGLMPGSAELDEKTMNLNVFMLNETNDHILVYMIFMFLTFYTSYLILIHSFGIWLLNALLFILEPISGAFIIHVSTLYFIWENSKFFWRCTKLMFCINHSFFLTLLIFCMYCPFFRLLQACVQTLLNLQVQIFWKEVTM